MTLIKYNARDVEFEIEDSANPGTWVQIGPKAINTFTRGFDYETTDTTTFGSEGRAESQNMQEGTTLGMEGFRLRDSATGALDPGQSMVEAQSKKLGEESLTGFRFAHKDDTSWTVWTTAHFQLGDQGGGNNDKTSWSCTATRSGAETTAVKA